MRGKMGQERSDSYSWQQAAGAPAPLNVEREDHWRHNVDNTVNAVSFGFVATAVLISMFLVMAIFERFLKPNSSTGSRSGDLEPHRGFNSKLNHQSPDMTIYTSEIPVLMPGDEIPTFIAHPAPVPCPNGRPSLPQPRHDSSINPNSNSSVNINAS